MSNVLSKTKGLSYIEAFINSRRLNLLIDTGASISLLKSSCVPKNVCVNDEKKIHLQGVSGIIDNKGIVVVAVEVADIKLNHKFCVIENISCDVDGILGIDFLRTIGGIIDFNNDLIKVRNSNVQIKMKLVHTISNCVGARSEQFMEVESDTDQDVVVLPTELCNGVFSAGMILRPVEGKVWVKVMNVNECSVQINNFKPTMVKLEEYESVKFNLTNPHANDRASEVLKLVKLEHLNSEERVAIRNIIVKYNDVFHLQSDKLGVTNLFKQTIALKDGEAPSYVKPYRLAHAQVGEIRDQIKNMLEEDIIEEARSEWSSPILLVPKKIDSDGNRKWRVVIDYRLVNKRIQDDKFPLPNITEILDSLAGAIYFSALDMAQGFYQLELDDQSRPITAFTVPGCGQFQLKRLPMGLKISPSAFSRMMTIAMSGLHFSQCLIYLDDLIVFGRNLAEHNINLHSVLSKMRDVNLKLNPAKCQFLKKSLVYLGHTISDRGIEPDQNKISVINNYPIPVNVDDVKRFVAMVNYYRRHIKHFAHISKPLNDLTKKGVAFLWTDECQSSFETLRNALTSNNILDYPDFSEENTFHLTSDASGKAIGGVLSNANGRPVAFASRALNKGELNYSTIEKELLAVVWGVKHFRPYLFGKKFVIHTDHRPLIYLFSLTTPSSRLIKFRLILEEYNFDIEYIKGNENVVADALSRINVSELKSYNNIEDVHVITRARAKQQQPDCQGVDQIDKIVKQPSAVQLIKAPKGKIWLQMDDNSNYPKGIVINLESKLGDKVICANFPNFQLDLVSVAKEVHSFLMKEDIREVVLYKTQSHIKLVNELVKNNDIRCILVADRITIEDHKSQRVILNDYHHLPTGGHMGINRMYQNISRRYTWPGLREAVIAYVKNCILCSKCKITKYVRAPLTDTSTANEAFEKVYIDLVGPLPTDNVNNKYIITIQCELTKFIEAYPVCSKNAESVASKFVNEFVLRYGIPKAIASDQGKEFIADVFSGACKLLQIEQLYSTAYHHESIGALENSHRQLNNFLKIQCQGNCENWSEWVPFWTFAHNNAVHSATGYTPAELVFGKFSSLPSNLGTVDPIYNFDSYINELRYRLQVALKDARDELVESKGNYKQRYDQKANVKDIKIGDKVLLINYARNNKLDPYYKGPYIVKFLRLPNIVINYKGKDKEVHINNTKVV